LFLNKESSRLSSKTIEGAHRWDCKSEMIVRCKP
jgi:hypothetical protein